jgi:hypothetical protein
LQWLLSLTVAAAAVVLLIRFVDANSTPRAQAPHVSAAGARSLNREAEIIDAQLQAPHVVRFSAGVAPITAIEQAIAAYMTTEIDFNRIAGPLHNTLCFRVTAVEGPRIAYRCSALSRDTSYPFEGIVLPATHMVVYCRHNPPPQPGDNVSVSRRCTG